MNYKDIEVFLELVRCRNITKAAENLYLSQSAVSNRLKSLEDEMGVQLFLRAKGHRIVELTRQGGEFIPVAERWKALYEETELIRSSALSVVRIATNESTFDRIVTPMLQGYIRRNPDKKVCVKICDSRETYDLVSKDLVDFGFAAYSSNLGGVVARCIDSQPLCLVRTVGAGDPSVPVHPGELDPEMEEVVRYEPPRAYRGEHRLRRHHVSERPGLLGAPAAGLGGAAGAARPAADLRADGPAGALEHLSAAQSAQPDAQHRRLPRV